MRMLNTTRVLVCLIVWTMFQCTTANDKSITKYFPLTNFIDQQIDLLSNQNLQITKTLQFGDSLESHILTSLDTTQWSKELKIFRAHDINKPVLIDAYETREELDGNGAKTIQHQLIDQSQTGILDLGVSYDPEGRITGLESSYQEDNLLYSNFRNVSMTFGSAGLSGYAVEGYHKIMFKDTVYYHIITEVEKSQ